MFWFINKCTLCFIERLFYIFLEIITCVFKFAEPQNINTIKKEKNHQSRFDAGYRMLGAGALG